MKLLMIDDDTGLCELLSEYLTAQGFTVDVISNYLHNAGVENYMIELGGEVIARGSKPNNTPWKIGIDKPLDNPEKRELHAIVPLLDKAMATSGNYRQFYASFLALFVHEE